MHEDINKENDIDNDAEVQNDSEQGNIQTLESEDWQKKCEELQKALDEKDLEISSIKKNHKIDLALRECGAKNIDILRKLIDFEQVSIVDGELQGFNEQVNFLRINHEYLFKNGAPYFYDPKTGEPRVYKPMKSDVEKKDTPDFKFAEDTAKPWNSK